jgi:hypothetical protein
MTASARRRSAAAARRLRAAKSEKPGHVLPAELRGIADRFIPQGHIASRWETIGPLVAEVLTRSNVRGVDSFRKALTHVGYFLAWADDVGLPLEIASVTRQNTDEYTRVGMAGSSEKSRADRRARLRGIADQVNPGQAPDRGISIAKPSLKPPYSPEEMARILRAAGTQPTPAQRRKLSLCVALGAGAGLDSPDLRSLRRQHLIDQGRAGITIAVPGVRSRTVTLFGNYEELLRDALDRTDPDALVLGSEEDRRNIAARAIGEAVIVGDCPRIEQSRLRSTWLARMLSLPVPLRVLLPAAGLQTGRTLGDLLPYLPPATGTESVLRDGRWAA